MVERHDIYEEHRKMEQQRLLRQNQPDIFGIVYTTTTVIAVALFITAIVWNWSSNG